MEKEKKEMKFGKEIYEVLEELAITKEEYEKVYDSGVRRSFMLKKGKYLYVSYEFKDGTLIKPFRLSEDSRIEGMM